MFLKISAFDRAYQDIFNDLLYFSKAQKFIGFAIFACLMIIGNYLLLRNREIWKKWKYGKIWKYGMELNVLGTVEKVL